MTPRVAVVGAGIAGAACARELARAGLAVDLVERGRAPGGRLASPTVHGRRVDLGAAYFTVQDDGFARLAADWAARGVARPWTDTLDVLGPHGRERTSGPMRWAAAGGLRSLARDLLTGVPAPVLAREITGLQELGHDAVVLAMPDPQAARLLGHDALDWIGYEPVIAVAAGWARREWSLDAAAFVNDDRDLSLVADDGSRRGDGAPVLVAHTTSALAAGHLDDAASAVSPVLAALERLLGITTAPDWTHVHRWTYAKPAATHGDDPFGLIEGARPVGVCGDSWCPRGAPRIEAAWLSGRAMARAIADRL